MTDTEIIKALKWCDQFENNIVFRGNGDEKCVQALQVLVVIKHALKEYNRQKATIEELRKGFIADADYFASEYDKNIKAEAIKEFAERIKKEASICCKGLFEYNPKIPYPGKSEIIKEYRITEDKLEAIVKEMVGENK